MLLSALAFLLLLIGCVLALKAGANPNAAIETLAGILFLAGFSLVGVALQMALPAVGF